MGYVCSNDGMDFPTKRELIEHMHEKYGCTFVEGDFSPLSEKILEAKKVKGDKRAEQLIEKHKFNRGE